MAAIVLSRILNPNIQVKTDLKDLSVTLSSMVYFDPIFIPPPKPQILFCLLQYVDISIV